MPVSRGVPTRLLVLLSSVPIARAQFLNCTLPGAGVSNEPNASEVNLLFLSAQSTFLFDSYEACIASGSGFVWNGSKCWQTPDDMLLPVFAYLAARDFNARDGKYIPAFAREGGGPGARTPEQRSPHRPQSTPDSQPHTAQDSQGPSRRTWRVAAGGVGSAP